MNSVLNGLQTNTKAGLLCTWAGPAFVVFFTAGMLIAKLFPPTNPLASAEQVVQFFVTNHTMIGLGTILMGFGAAFMAVWAVAIAVQIRRTELGSPLMTYASLAAAFFVAIDAAVIPTIWAVLSFRGGEISPDIVLILNDLCWFLFLFPWQLAGVWFIAVGLAILWDKSPEPVFPRWAGWASLWFFVMTFPAGLIVFFKSGPFAYNGLLAFYLPLGVLFIWIIAMTVVMLQAYKKQALEQREG